MKPPSRGSTHPWTYSPPPSASGLVMPQPQHKLLLGTDPVETSLCSAAHTGDTSRSCRRAGGRAVLHALCEAALTAPTAQLLAAASGNFCGAFPIQAPGSQHQAEPLPTAPNTELEHQCSPGTAALADTAAWFDPMHGSMCLPNAKPWIPDVHHGFINIPAGKCSSCHLNASRPTQPAQH